MTPDDAPTLEEILAARDGITADGRMSDFTLALAALTVIDPTLRGFLRRVAFSIDATPDVVTGLQGALLYGLDIGMRIGQARVDKLRHEVAHNEPKGST